MTRLLRRTRSKPPKKPPPTSSICMNMGSSFGGRRSLLAARRASRRSWRGVSGRLPISSFTPRNLNGSGAACLLMTSTSGKSKGERIKGACSLLTLTKWYL